MKRLNHVLAYEYCLKLYRGYGEFEEYPDETLPFFQISYPGERIVKFIGRDNIFVIIPLYGLDYKEGDHLDLHWNGILLAEGIVNDYSICDGYIEMHVPMTNTSYSVVIHIYRETK